MLAKTNRESARTPDATVTPRSRAAWRQWLQRNHESRGEVWVVFYKRHTDEPTLSYADAVEEALCFGWVDGVKRSIDVQRYTHRFSPRTLASKWSALNRARAKRMEQAGRMTDAGRKAIQRAKRHGTWAGTAPAIDLSMPAEFAARLELDKKAAAFFDSLAQSYQQQFVAWINTARRAETKARRVKQSLALLRRGEKLGMR
jgi:uncharacterized protein YdeI (YjbR/CyaY-like superfamily)